MAVEAVFQATPALRTYFGFQGGSFAQAVMDEGLAISHESHLDRCLQNSSSEAFTLSKPASRFGIVRNDEDKKIFLIWCTIHA